MDVLYSDWHNQHNPPFQFVRDGMYPYSENPARVTAIREALLVDSRFRFAEPELITPYHIEEDPRLLAVHNHEYLQFLDTIYSDWTLANRPKTGVIPDTFAVRSPSHCPTDRLSQPGYYCFDAQTPIVAGTKEAAVASASCALAGAHKLITGAKSAYALCRPPGHHACRSGYGGYCYLNNAAIAAAELNRKTGGNTVSVLDIDYHHGNGTQEIFYSTDAIITASIHAHPNRAYPFFWGYEQEDGAGAGKGCNLNVPLVAGTGDTEYVDVLRRTLDYIAEFSPKYVVVSLGLDTFSGDPLGDFDLSFDGFAAIGHTIAELGVPTLFVQEGGYDVPNLGRTVYELLAAFDVEACVDAPIHP